MTLPARAGHSLEVDVYMQLGCANLFPPCDKCNLQIIADPINI